VKGKQRQGLKLWLPIVILALAASMLVSDVPMTPTVLANSSAQGPELPRVDPVRAYRAQQKKKRQDQLVQKVWHGRVLGPPSHTRTYVRVTDTTETLNLDVPAEWQDVDLGDWNYEGHPVGVFVAASTDLNAFERDLSAPGIFFASSAQLVEEYTETDMLALEEQHLLAKFPNCQRQGEVEYADQLLSGRYYTYSSCTGSTEETYFILVAAPPTRTYLVVLHINLLEFSTYETITQIFDTFQVIGVPGQDEHHEEEEHEAHAHP
jgi:hypothetical protein